MLNIQPFTATFEARAYPAGEEFATLDEALAWGREKLVAGLDQFEVIRWYHTPNRQGCKPDLVSNSCSLTVYKLSDLSADGELVEKPVDIHGGW